MKKTLMLTAMLVLVCSGQMQAQGLFGKLKEKAQKAIVNKAMKTDKDNTEEIASDTMDESDTESEFQLQPLDQDQVQPQDEKPTIPQASDVIPKRQTSTVVWDGVVTPSKASTAKALMAELPPLPAAEKMARSTMEERDA